jgi:hypothetical protein
MNFFENLFFSPQTPKLIKKNKGNDIGSKGGKAIAEALKINSSIQYLNLYSNSFFFFFSHVPFWHTNSQQNQF